MMKRKPPAITSLQFFYKLVWFDGTPLMSTIEQYRRRLFTSALDTVGSDGWPVFNTVLAAAERRIGSLRTWSWPDCIAPSCGARFRAEILSYLLATKGKLRTIWTC